MNKTILGVDCSSTTIGWCALEIDVNNNITYKSSGYIKPIKDGTMIERIVQTRKDICDVINKRYYSIYAR
jgi:Holliday junction resolvasome RuvABC endonuclease subunit